MPTRTIARVAIRASRSPAADVTSWEETGGGRASARTVAGVVVAGRWVARRTGPSPRLWPIPEGFRSTETPLRVLTDAVRNGWAHDAWIRSRSKPMGCESNQEEGSERTSHEREGRAVATPAMVRFVPAAAVRMTMFWRWLCFRRLVRPAWIAWLVLLGVGGAPAYASRWTVVPVPSPTYPDHGYLQAVSCTSSTACTAVGYSRTNQAFAERWDGRNWLAQTTPDLSDTGDKRSLNDVSCTSDRFCTAVGGIWDFSNGGDGYYPLVERWDGARWTAEFPQYPRTRPTSPPCRVRRRGLVRPSAPQRMAPAGLRLWRSSSGGTGRRGLRNGSRYLGLGGRRPLPTCLVRRS